MYHFIPFTIFLDMITLSTWAFLNDLHKQLATELAHN